MPKVDGLVKSLQSRHSRESGSPEVIDFPGFPRCGNDKNREDLTFYEFVKVDVCYFTPWRDRSLRLPGRSSLLEFDIGVFAYLGVHLFPIFCGFIKI